MRKDMSDLRIENIAGGQQMLQGECREMYVEKKKQEVLQFSLNVPAERMEMTQNVCTHKKAAAAATGSCPQIPPLSEHWGVKRTEKGEGHYFFNEGENVFCKS